MAGAPAAPGATADLVNATAQILMVATIGGQEQVYGWGSGTILTSDGLILTNAHVAMPSSAGLGIYEADPTPAVDPEDLIVALVKSEDQPAVPTYRATVISADGYLDAAVIKIDRDLNGQPLSGADLGLPTVPMGDSDALHAGDPLTVVGFPGIGGDTISLSSGRVSGFLSDDRIGTRAWIKTDAIVSGGNSGGLAANDAGELIGIPTRAPSDTGGYSLVRPIALVKPLIEGAQAGRRTVDSPYLVPGTGSEALQLDTWTDTAANCPAQNRVASYPSGTTSIVASMRHTGFASGEDIISQWRLDGEVVNRNGIRLGSGAEAGGCYSGELYYDRGLPDGTYVLEMFGGPTLRALTTAQTTIGSAAASGSATLSGLVQNADSGRPIEGAVIFLLVPGTDIDAWFNNPQETQVASFGKTGSDGTFLISSLTVGSSYPAVAMAEGYVAAGGTIGPMQAGANSMINPISLAPVAP
jgi:S1-C subfamily serine protease